MPRFAPALVIAAAALGSTSPTAAEPTIQRSTQRVAPTVDLWLQSVEFRRLRGRRLPGGPDAAAALTRVPISVRLAAASDVRRLRALEGPEFTLRRFGGAIARVGTVVAATATAKGLARLRGERSVVRVELAVPPPVVPPLDVTASQILVPETWQRRDGQGLPLTGNGVLIADIDTGVDVFHPMFFRADGGYFAWIDVDTDGAFQPGVDAVDLDASGTADPGEILGFVDVRAHVLSQLEPVLGADDAFEVGWDYLYVDANDNGQREFGEAAGFTEQDPTYGEQWFVVDDVDGDGVVDKEEKLVGLGTSKIRAVYDIRERTRGVDLITTPGRDTPGAFHGTGVSGILVGGQPGFSRMVGIAPDAELILGAYSLGNLNTTELHAWAVQHAPDVMLHEYAGWILRHLDGSSNEETMVDASAAQGIVQVTPAGNLGGSGKHAVATISPQATEDIAITVPSSGFSVWYLSVLWRDVTRDLSLSFVDPQGVVIPLGGLGDVVPIGTDGLYAWSLREDSPRGTVMFSAGVYNAVVPEGQWRLRVHDPAAQGAGDVDLAMYSYDNLTSWGRGIHFTAESERHLVCAPATSDNAITLAAYAGHGTFPFRNDVPAGALRPYSGRGDRIDGAAIIDITAPDNPLTTVNPQPFGSWFVGDAALMEFGGTSGAGPHVAGVAALVKQMNPSLDGLAVREAIRTSAGVDGDVTGDGSHTVSQLWGAGKLRAYQAIFGEDPPANTPPVLQAAAIAAEQGVPVSITPQASDAEDPASALAIVYDLDYDGVWDIGPLTGEQIHEATFDELGTHVIKIQVRDSAGATDAALVAIEVATRPPDPDAGPGPDPDAGPGPDALGPGVEPGCPVGKDDCDAGGCGCTVAGAPITSDGFWLAVLFGLALLRVRRR